MRKLLFLTAIAVCGTALAEGDGELVEQKSNNAWHFRIGPVMSPRVRVKVHGPRLLLPSSLPVTGTSTSGIGATAPADPSEGFVDRTYADGYVKPDEGTSDPDSMTPGLTWNWGADDVGSQYSNGRIEFHTDMTRWDETVSSSAFGGGSGSDSDRDILLGVEAMGGWTFYDDERFDAAVDAGFRFYGSGDLEATSRHGASATTTRREYRYADSYDASGWTSVPQGAHDGSASGPDTLIGATPTRREELMGTTDSTESYSYRSHTKLDYTIWDLRLGPTLGWKATDWLTLRGGVYGLIGLVDVTLKTSQSTPNGSSSAKQSKCEPVFGMAAGLSAQLDLTDNLFLMGGVEYDWWSDKVDVSAGGADARIELSDFSVSLAVGIEF